MLWHFKTEVNEKVIDAERKSHRIRGKKKKKKVKTIIKDYLILLNMNGDNKLRRH